MGLIQEIACHKIVTALTVCIPISLLEWLPQQFWGDEREGINYQAVTDAVLCVSIQQVEKLP